MLHFDELKGSHYNILLFLPVEVLLSGIVTGRRELEDAETKL